jgi:hypothetical protein
MARSISVKVPVAGLLAEIENKIAEIDEAVANYPAQREAYEKAQEQYKEDVVAFLAKFLTSNHHSVGYDYNDTLRISRAYNGRFELVLDTDAISDFPKEPVCPTKPNQNEWFGREHTTRKSLLEKNLKILRMTSQEEVNASTYGAVMELL